MRIDNTNYEVDKPIPDEFGRVSGIFAVDKPIGKTSHDMVYEYRKKLNTKKVGHAGALDPFASGLLIILAGKATKQSDKFLEMDKEYIAEIALGITTETLDPEGKITKSDTNDIDFNTKKIKETLETFKPKYDQYVPIYSSVKVEGKKLRELARSSDSYEIYESEGTQMARFIKKGEIVQEIKIPKKELSIYEIELLDDTIKQVDTLKLYRDFQKEIESAGLKQIRVITIRVKCSKGTYIRKLAEDIGNKLNTKAMLINLRRTQVGQIRI